MHVVAKKHHHRSNIPVAVFHLENRPRGDKIAVWQSTCKGGSHEFPYIQNTPYVSSREDEHPPFPKWNPAVVQRLRICRKLSTFFPVWNLGMRLHFIPRVLPWRWHFLSLVTIIYGGTNVMVPPIES